MAVDLLPSPEKRPKTEALALLKKDHADVRDLFEEIRALSDRAFSSRQKLFEKIAFALTSHAQIEERLFYPALKEKVGKGNEESDLVLEAYEEHALVKSLLEEVHGADPKEESYKAKITVLMEMVEHHIKEEESDMFKSARAAFEKHELESLGRQMAEMKAEQ